MISSVFLGYDIGSITLEKMPPGRVLRSISVKCARSAWAVDLASSSYLENPVIAQPQTVETFYMLS